VPRSQCRGLAIRANVVAACERCNHARDNLHPAKFLGMLLRGAIALTPG
jgi:5-methylcytosine-specific restriction endonuclease McrA